MSLNPTKIEINLNTFQKRWTLAQFIPISPPLLIFGRNTQDRILTKSTLHYLFVKLTK